MKVSPMAAGSGGAPGVDLGNVNLGTTASPDKLAAAKALAADKNHKEKRSSATNWAGFRAFVRS